MKKATLGLFSVLFLLSLAVAQPVAAQKSTSSKETPPLFGLDRDLLISPQAILLDETKALGIVEVTIHADILYGQVDKATVELEGIIASVTFADDRGDLVAKFDWDEVAALFDGEGEPGDSDTFTLTLTCMSGGQLKTFVDDVRVVF